MFTFDHLTRVATAAVGALILSTLSIVAAVGPAEMASANPTAYASLHTGSVARG